MQGLLDYPHYTRPEFTNGLRVPAVLLGGNHADIVRWRSKQALGRTWQRRPDLLQRFELSDEQEKLLEECNLHTIVRLPKGVFAPYTSINTNLLFFTKGEPTKDIWYYEHPYPLGQKSYNKTKPIRIEEFEPEKKWWKKRKKSEFAWKVPVQEIIDSGYNLDRKNPNSTDDGPGDPDELLQAFEKLTGCGVLVNTSFNVRGEPIVCTPTDAYRCFMRTEMDLLVLENCILYKEKQPEFVEEGDWWEEHELD